MHLKAVVDVFTEFASLDLAENWDNVGLLTCPTYEKDVGTVVFTIDLTEEVLEEAVACGADMIFSYHPPIFSPLKSLRNSEWKERIIIRCIEKGIAIFSPHTALDAVNGGMNDWIISCFEPLSSRPLKQHFDQNVKSEFQVECKFPLEYDLRKIECIPRTQVIIVSLYEHYRVVKILACKSSLMEVISLLSGDGITVCLSKCQPLPRLGCGSGRFGILKKPVSIKDAIHLVKKHLHLKYLRISFGKQHTVDSKISSVAVCAGSGSKVLFTTPAELYITGEMSHHDLLNAKHLGITVFMCEHSNSERGFLDKLIQNLHVKLEGVKLVLSRFDKDPVGIF